MTPGGEGQTLSSDHQISTSPPTGWSFKRVLPAADRLHPLGVKSLVLTLGAEEAFRMRTRWKVQSLPSSQLDD